MPDFPINYRARLAERVRIQREANAEAARRAAVTGRSMKCSGYAFGNHVPTAPPRHAGEPDGCKNDGTGCVCECHDPAPESTRA